jgi:hypothetical protein
MNKRIVINLLSQKILMERRLPEKIRESKNKWKRIKKY